MKLAACVIGSNISHTLEPLTRNQNIANIELKIRLPKGRKKITVKIDDGILVRYILRELINNDLIKDGEEDFTLEVKGGTKIRRDENIRESDVEDGDTIVVVPRSMC